MSRVRFVAGVLVAVAVLVAQPERPAAQQPASPAAFVPHKPTIAQFLKPGLPIELVSARKADRIAWIAYEEGRRNVFVASAPLFRPVRVTSFLKDDGIDLTQVRISDSGGVVAFVRGSAPNGDGWVANPASDPEGADRTIWAAQTAPGSAPARRLAEGSNPELSPDGRVAPDVKDGQIYRASVNAPAAASKIEKGEKPFITAWGRNSGPKWSPDGTKIAFSSNRNDHSFIGIYDMRARTVSWIAPGVDRDTNPTWSGDGKQIVFLRRPGLSFGQQATPGRGSGLPDAAGGRGGAGAAAAAPGGRQGGAAGRQGGAVAAGAPGAPGAQGQVQATQPNPLINEPGLFRSALPGGNTFALVVADIKTGEAREVWHPAADDRVFGNINNIQWAAGTVVFQMPQQGGGRGGGQGPGQGQGQAQGDEWERYYSLSLSGNGAVPIRLTTTDGIIEDATAWTLSKDGKTFYYCTNAGDIDRRHIWAVPTSGGVPRQITTGDGIDNVPVALASGKQIAVLSADAKRPMSVGLWPADGGGAQKVIYPTLGKDFPTSAHVVPTNVMLKADDGLEFHNQLFLPADIKPGERRPALIFVHGGPQRQMLLGYHYLSFYHVFYAVNQWLTSQGYIVMSVNYRSGVGYGRSFRSAPNTGARGNAEYKDVLAAGKYLAGRPDVDPNRVGIWGLSYGGLLTAEALARNSDIFKAGVDLAGVHLEGSSLNPEDVWYKASSISEINNWKAPVLLVHGDDDRNVNFSQTVGLVQLLRARNIYHELIVFPDDVHETLLHSRWLYTFDRMEQFLKRFLAGN